MNSTLTDQIENDALNVEGFVTLVKLGMAAMKELVSLNETTHKHKLTYY